MFKLSNDSHDDLVVHILPIPNGLDKVIKLLANDVLLEMSIQLSYSHDGFKVKEPNNKCKGPALGFVNISGQ
jgi:hypothetical protein